MTLVGSIHRIFRNDGIGMFTATVTADLAFTEATSGTGASRYIRGMAIADTEGDGLMDVYTVKSTTGGNIRDSRVEKAKRNRNEGFTVKQAPSCPRNLYEHECSPASVSPVFPT